ncbi:protein transport protein Sec61 subunit gamma-like [Neomonachus schauinslandi]|uniref:Protein transport protein Sec61 subunit gamma n=1 Tax=Neomonachus schauinslandi TaxID=29088 RepID=A0A2Y9GNS1_NEOSC|nr:protein transport protein Sec61 subunit gamma-like [Neomonachus schauinslandi]
MPQTWLSRILAGRSVCFCATCPWCLSGWLAVIKDQVMQFVEPSRQFVKDSIRVVKRCTKPDRKECQKMAMATALGFAILGFIGFFVKLILIPLNNIIVGS